MKNISESAVPTFVQKMTTIMVADNTEVILTDNN